MADRELHADCASCVALCCVAPAFARSADFAIDKPAGQACPNLLADHRCGVHDRLDQQGFHGCVVFDCFGAGQRISQETFGGGGRTPEMFALLPIVRQLHELMWLLTEALRLPEAHRLHPELRRALDETDRVAGGDPAQLRGLDLTAYRNRINPLLQRASDAARVPRGPDHRGKNLIGRRMRGGKLRGASFRGALLIGADLRDADLRRADFTGADLRGADLRGADLTGALFLTESQKRAAVTDRT